MKNKITLLILIGFLTIACHQERNIEIEPESITENDLTLCKNKNCPEITINYLHVFGDKDISEKINKKIDDFIIGSLSIKDDSLPQAKTIKEAAANFIKMFFEDQGQFPDMAGEYFAEISVNEIYNTPKHLCFELSQYLYTGGAHGYRTTSFINIDPKTGDELTFDDLFKDKKEFTAFAEQKFRAQQKIPKDQSINDTGFWFEDNTFFLPESAGFTPDSLIFVYNQYDIASYADGPIELKISAQEARPYLRID